MKRFGSSPFLRRGVSFVFAVVAALTCLPAFAQDTGGLTDEDVYEPEAFIRTRDPNTDLCLWWETRNYLYNLDAAGNTDTPGTTELAAIDASFQTWTTLARGCSDFTFQKGPNVTTVKVGYDPRSADNTNVITFREKRCADVVPADDPCLDNRTCGNVYRCWNHPDTTIALTTTSFQNQTGVIYDADIEINSSVQANGSRYLFTTVSSPVCEPGRDAVNCVSTDVQNTVTHEIGHVVGLDHVLVAGSTMEAAAPPGELQKRILDDGSAQGFCSIYPKGRSTPRCDPSGSASGSLQRGVFAFGYSKGCAVVGGGAIPALAALALWALGRRRRASGKDCSRRP